MDIRITIVRITIILLGVALYFLPTIIAGLRKHTNLTAIILLNLLLGWSGLGWVIALIWAVKKPESAA